MSEIASSVNIGENIDDTLPLDNLIQIQSLVSIPIVRPVTMTSTSVSMACREFVYGDTATVGARWETWLEIFELYILAIGLTDAAKIKACFLTHVGMDVFIIFKTLRKASNDDTYIEAHTKLTKYFVSSRSQFCEDQNFRRASKRADESVDEYILRLRQLAKHCKYTDIDAEILAHFVANCNMEQFQIKACREDTLTLEKAILLAKGYERDSTSLALLKNKTYNDTINFASSYNNCEKTQQFSNKQAFNQNSFNNSLSYNQCRYCGRQTHLNKQQCPAYGCMCKICGKKHHFANFCQSQSQQQGYKQQPQQSQSQHRSYNAIQKQQQYGSNVRGSMQTSSARDHSRGRNNLQASIASNDQDEISFCDGMHFNKNQSDYTESDEPISNNNLIRNKSNVINP